MSKEYDNYLVEHKENVRKGFDWIAANLPRLIQNYNGEISRHDESKSNQDEYYAYDSYFYGGNKSYAVVHEFNKAWLTHIHRNPHHWQYWILVNDNPEEGEILIEIPYNYIIEMICDWWSFAWRKGDLKELFDWYENHKHHIKLNRTTRGIVEDILDQIKTKLEELENDQN